MTYGMDMGLFLGSGPTLHPVKRPAANSSSRSYLAWKALDEEGRLDLVDKALAEHANDDCRDGYPLAL